MEIYVHTTYAELSRMALNHVFLTPYITILWIVDLKFGKFKEAIITKLRDNIYPNLDNIALKKTW